VVLTVLVLVNAIAWQIVLPRALVVLHWAWRPSFAVMVLLEATQADVFHRQAEDVDGKSELAQHPVLLLIALHHHLIAIGSILSLIRKVVK
jgi:hypothetical protein